MFLAMFLLVDPCVRSVRVGAPRASMVRVNFSSKPVRAFEHVPETALFWIARFLVSPLYTVSVVDDRAVVVLVHLGFPSNINEGLIQDPAAGYVRADRKSTR